VIPPIWPPNPRLSHWVSVHADGTIDVRCGKVELGQGVLTALAQIAADELDVAYDRIRMVPLTTDSSRTRRSPPAAAPSRTPARPCARSAPRSAPCSSTPRQHYGHFDDLLSVDDGMINGAITYWD